MSNLTKREQIAAMFYVRSTRPPWFIDPKRHADVCLKHADELLELLGTAERDEQPDARDARIAELEHEARRFYYGTEGKFVVLESAEAVREKRIAAAREIDKLQKHTAELEHALHGVADLTAQISTARPQPEDLGALHGAVSEAASIACNALADNASPFMDEMERYVAALERIVALTKPEGTIGGIARQALKGASNE